MKFAGEKGVSTANNPLEQYVLLSKSAKGAAAAELIMQAVDAQGVYVFGELLDMTNIMELANGQHSKYYHLLQLFAYGTYADYKQNADKYPELVPNQMKKLKLLSIVTLATKFKRIPYSVLQEQLDLRNLRDLEDLIIEAVYSHIIQGKLDQKLGQLEVDHAIGRDIKPEDIDNMTKTLEEWCENCEVAQCNIESLINQACAAKETSNKRRMKVEQEVASIKESLSAQEIAEEHMTSAKEAVASQVEIKPKKKLPKFKGIKPRRPSGTGMESD